MTQQAYATIDREQLAKKMETATPDNEHPRHGYALIDVLSPEAFDRERIPGSMNIPQREEGAFQKRFEKEKEIVLYCASPTCQASRSVARDLASEGYQRVVDYEGGLSDWKEGGHPTEGYGA